MSDNKLNGDPRIPYLFAVVLSPNDVVLAVLNKITQPHYRFRRELNDGTRLDAPGNTIGYFLAFSPPAKGTKMTVEPIVRYFGPLFETFFRDDPAASTVKGEPEKPRERRPRRQQQGAATNGATKPTSATTRAIASEPAKTKTAPAPAGPPSL
ncbi:hypothetical protein KC614_02995 [candidate division WWE3 bacterium]|uniref:Uncharacterized protein n=1 Tax=candidate division WWE3 bacterium TaxID=2053526 RepID=A0A955LKS1_UNCKA|nr:hypothetical protein [candidate division WWE3 bacterium]